MRTELYTRTEPQKPLVNLIMGSIKKLLSVQVTVELKCLCTLCNPIYFKLAKFLFENNENFPQNKRKTTNMKQSS